MKNIRAVLRRRFSHRQLNQAILRTAIEVLEKRQLLSSSYTVSSLSGGDGSGTLRYEIQQAETAAGPQKITFESYLFNAGAATITLGGSPLEIDDTAGTLTIQGPGADLLTINGQNESTVLVNDAESTAIISGLTITGGNGENSVSKMGGGIANLGTLTLQNSTITGNHSTTFIGGGIYDYGTLYVIGSTINNNYAEISGSAIAQSGTSPLTIVNSTISGNLGSGAVASNYLDITDSTVADNATYGVGGAGTLNGTIVADNDGQDLSGTFSGTYNLIGDGSGGLTGANGNLLNFDPELSPLGYYGGTTETMPLFSTSVAIGAGSSFGQITDQRGLPRQTPFDIGAYQTNALVVNTSQDDPVGYGQLSLRDAVNLANLLGGDQTVSFDPSLMSSGTGNLYLNTNAVELEDLTGTELIQGPTSGDLNIHMQPGGYGIIVDSNVTGEISDVTITGGYNYGQRYGGAITNKGNLTIDYCDFTGNASTVGGAIYNASGAEVVITNSTISGNYAAFGGGGIANYDGTMDIYDSTISGNSAGIDGAGVQTFEGNLTIVNSTICNNTAWNGAGVDNSNGSVTIIDSTIADNTAEEPFNGQPSVGGGICSGGSAFSTLLEGTIVALNVGGDILGSASGSYNLIGGGSGGLSSGNHNYSGNPDLTPLGHYGGPTETFALLAGSPAIGYGSSFNIATDQRGLGRPGLSGEYDIGAFQTQDTLDVNSTADGPVGSGSLTLRDAIALADALGDNQTVTFDSALIADGAATIDLDGTALTLDDTSGKLTISGPGADLLTIDAQHQSSVFVVDGNSTAEIDNLTITYGSAIYGGGILNDGTLTVTNSIITGNTSTNFGGGIDNQEYDPLTIDDSIISDNTSGYGGGIFGGNLSISNSKISGNTAIGFDRPIAYLYAIGGGGGIFGSGSIANSIVSGNFAGYGGGVAAGGGFLTISNSTITDNTATELVGGGIWTFFCFLTINDCTISGNIAAYAGGGIVSTARNYYTATTIINSTITGNTALYGAGIDNYQGSPLAILDSTIANNSATYLGGGIAAAYESGGIYDSFSAGRHQATLSNSQLGPGLQEFADESFQPSIAEVVPNGTSVILDGTIVADNSAGDLSGSFNGSYNLIGDDTGSTAGLSTDAPYYNKLGENPELSVLGNYGGPTQTMALLPGSPAFGAGAVFDGPDGNPITTDQRGVTRPQGSTSNIGAFQGFTVTNVANDDSSGSLRWAIEQAENVGGDQVISLLPSLTSETAQTITLNGSPIELDDTTGTLTIVGPGADLLTISANTLSGVFVVDANSSAIIEGLNITDGNATLGGGIDNSGTLTLDDSEITGNSASSGGGIYNTGTLNVNDSVITGNVDGDSTSGEGINNAGGIVNISYAIITDNTGSTSGIYNDDGGSVTLSNSTVSDNSGGGIVDNDASVSITASTVSGNSGPGIQNNNSVLELINVTIADNIGPGIVINSDGSPFSATIIDCTISGNSATESAGGIQINASGSSGTITVEGTIVAGNTGGDVAGTIVGSYDLIGDGSGGLSGTGNILNVDPLLAPLGNYGGPTQTMALLPGSPALDVGTIFDAPGGMPITMDQRGISRPQGGIPDIGAFESQGFVITPISNTEVTVAGTPFSDFIVQVTANDPGLTDLTGGIITFSAPSSGATATLGVSTPLNAADIASVTAIANDIFGEYSVIASAAPSVGNPSTILLVNDGALTATVNVTQPQGADSPAIITISNVNNAWSASMAGGFVYGYDLDDDGTYEIQSISATEDIYVRSDVTSNINIDITDIYGLTTIYPITIDAAIPGIPIIDSPEIVNTDYASFEWRDLNAPNITDLIVEYSSDPTFSTFSEVDQSVSSYLDGTASGNFDEISLQPLETLYFRVAAKSDAGTSDFSNVISVMNEILPYGWQIQSSAINTHENDLSWPSVNNQDELTIMRELTSLYYSTHSHDDTNSDWTIAATIPIANGTFADTGLDAETGYTYTAYITDPSGNTFSLGIVLAVYTFPASPTGLSIQATTEAGYDTIFTIGWTNQSNGSIIVESSPDGTDSWSTLETLPQEDTSQAVVDLSADMDLYVRVRAVGDSYTSNELSDPSSVIELSSSTSYQNYVPSVELVESGNNGIYGATLGTGQSLDFTVIDSYSLSTPLVVNLTATGNAIAGKDYTFPASVTIPANEESVIFSVQALDGGENTPTEYAYLMIAPDSTYTLVGDDAYQFDGTTANSFTIANPNVVLSPDRYRDDPEARTVTYVTAPPNPIIIDDESVYQNSTIGWVPADVDEISTSWTQEDQPVVSGLPIDLILNNIDRSSATITFNYDASDPSLIQPPNNEHGYILPSGTLRLWESGPANGLTGFIESGQPYPATVFSAYSLEVEAVSPSPNGQSETITVTVNLGDGSPPIISSIQVTPIAHLIAVDGNQNQTINFSSLDSNDVDVPKGNYYNFWLNDNVDSNSGGGDQQNPATSSMLDYQQSTIQNVEDTEDWAPLALSAPSWVSNSTDWYYNLYWAGSDGPGINIIKVPENTGENYLLDNSVAQTLVGMSEINNLSNGGHVEIAGNVPGSSLWGSDGKLYILFDGTRVGSGTLIADLYVNGMKVTSDSVIISIQPVSMMYETYSLGNAAFSNAALANPAALANETASPVIPFDYNTSVPGGGALGSELSPFEYYPQSPQTDNYILFVPGWRMLPWEKEEYADTMYKRLFWQGYQGRFGVFDWQTEWLSTSFLGKLGDLKQPETNSENYDRSELVAWYSATALNKLLVNLDGQYGYSNVDLFAHSMGNIVASEALKLAGTTKIVHAYIASQAAVAAEMYNPTNYTPLFQGIYGPFGPSTPDIYAGYFANINQATDLLYNFYNPNDAALTGLPFGWETNEAMKPDDGYFAKGNQFYKTTYSVAYDGDGNPYLVPSYSLMNLGNTADLFEAFAFAAEPRSIALGAQPGIGGPFTGDTNLTSFNFGTDHSGEFDSTNAARADYWGTVLSDFGLPFVI